MPRYIYACRDCEKKATQQHIDKLIKKGDEYYLPLALYEELVLFETSHRMTPTKTELRAATECPRCFGHNCVKSFHGLNVLGYIRGYGFLDRSGVRRDMDLHHLINDDPYGEYRIPGEVDELRSSIKRKGRHNSKPKHFVSTPAIKRAVNKVAKKKID